MLIALGLMVGIWATGRMSTPQNPDPGSATWDEFVGMWLTCVFVPLSSPVWLAAAFVVFRAFDVVKPWPCRRLERLPAGWGIMLDDVGAGTWGALVMLAGVLLWRLIEPCCACFSRQPDGVLTAGCHLFPNRLQDIHVGLVRAPAVLAESGHLQEKR